MPDIDTKNNNQVPSSHLNSAKADIIADLALLSEVFQRIENETAEIAEMIFDYLIEASDLDIIEGTIPDHPDPKISGYVKILNRLFRLSRRRSKDGIMSLIVINRKTVRELDKKTFAISMCFDGGVSLDILCAIVNEENLYRTPTKSPVKVTIRKFVGQENQVGR